MAERTLEVTSRLGLHARAAANLVRVASRFQSKLTLQRLEGGLEADAKSILSRLGLDKHLSPTRKNGLFAMVERIRALAVAPAVSAGAG